MQLKNLSFAAFAATAAAQSLTEALGKEPSLSNLTAYLNLYPGLVTQLESMRNITLLAPNNQALSKVLGNNSNLAGDAGAIQALLTYHVLDGNYTNFTTGPTFIPTALTNSSYANVTGGQVVEAIGQSNSTRFFTGLSKNSSTVGNASNFTGGTIHIIDSVLTIPENCSQTAINLGASSFVGALNATNLVNTVDGMSDVTVFAPSNAAFESVGGNLANLSTAGVTNLLEYHVVNGTVDYSSDLMKNTTLTTIKGDKLHITKDNGTIFVNSARVIVPDVLTSNGVIHVIDGVLNPANSTATANPSLTTDNPAFASASSVTNAPYTSNVPQPTSTINTAGGGAANSAAGGSGASSSSSGVAMPMKTGAMGAAALFGGAAVLINM